MASYQTRWQLPSRFRLVLASFLQSDSLAFAEVLPEEEIQQAFDEEGANFAQDEDDIYTPPLTLWAFLSQILFKEEQRSCAAKGKEKGGQVRLLTEEAGVIHSPTCLDPHALLRVEWCFTS